MGKNRAKGVGGYFFYNQGGVSIPTPLPPSSFAMQIFQALKIFEIKEGGIRLQTPPLFGSDFKKNL